MRPLRRTISACAVSLLLASGCVAADRALVPSEAVCKPASRDQLAWLDATGWRPFERYIRVCPVSHDRSSPAALLIVSVWADLYYADKPSGTLTVAMPKPLLFAPGGKLLGELPVNFPGDPPVELVVRFTDWRQNVPHQIRLCVVSPTASGDQALTPLRYDPASQRYQTATGPAAKTSKGDCRVR